MTKKMKVMERGMRETRRRLRMLELDVRDLCEDMIFEPEYRPPKNTSTPSYIG